MPLNLESIDLESLPKTQKLAKEIGSKYYFSGKLCAHKHLAPRYTSTFNCVVCQYNHFSKRRSGNPALYRQSTNKWKRKNYHRVLADNSLRRAGVSRACPTWVCKDAIDQIYFEAQELSKKTNVVYHVDHIIPLKGKTVSGLHVPWNLQILSATENMKKGNRF